MKTEAPCPDNSTTTEINITDTLNTNTTLDSIQSTQPSTHLATITETLPTETSTSTVSHGESNTTTGLNTTGKVLLFMFRKTKSFIFRFILSVMSYFNKYILKRFKY